MWLLQIFNTMSLTTLINGWAWVCSTYFIYIYVIFNYILHILCYKAFHFYLFLYFKPQNVLPKKIFIVILLVSMIKIRINLCLYSLYRTEKQTPYRFLLLSGYSFIYVSFISQYCLIFRCRRLAVEGLERSTKEQIW